MSQLRFPTWHTVDQVKRNAKRLSEDQGIPLNKALDQLACASLGLPDQSIRWAEAVKALELTAQHYCLPEDFSIPEESRAAFINGVVVSIDIKDAENFTNTGPWVQDEELKVLLSPALVASSALTGADEDGRKIPLKTDWEYALEGLMWPTIYRFTGGTPPKDSLAVVQDICDRNFFPPDLVWIQGQLQPIPHNIPGKIVQF